MEEKQTEKFSFDSLLASAVKIPGVKVNRQKFLASMFSSSSYNLKDILENGPVSAGVPRSKLKQLSKRLIAIRTSESSVVSFAAGIPGGWAMAATIPADMLQFFGMTLRLAQEIPYLYGAPDLWTDGAIDNDRVRNQLMLYCGVMFGATGAAAGVRVLSKRIAEVAAKKIPQKALTKTAWYPILKKIGRAIGISITKKSVANGVSKVVPIVGGVVSGAINFASMVPMANKLLRVMDEARFEYSEAKLQLDLKELDLLSSDEESNQFTEENENKEQ